jgi:hypothetical protein
MKKRYAMTIEGSAFIRDGVDLSWPQGGARDVVELEEDDLSDAFRMRLMNRVIAEVDEPANKLAFEPTPYKVFEGDEARKIMSEPAGPVVVQHHGKRSSVVREVTLLDSRDQVTDSVPTVVVHEKPVPVLATMARRRS